jgi:hypothetical protein
MLMTETRQFPTGVIASISSGIMLCRNFSAIHEAAEYLMGHPIWTHHFADNQLMADMRRMVAEQCPGIPNRDGQITPENWREKLAELEAEFGPTVTIRKGPGLTAMLPTDGIPDHVETIAVTTDSGRT